ncbi:MAG: DUF2036 domain-containing protein [Gammaproteobacteria bacterium]|nr:DUF2036 domain-containing protein [Gammaproteobacteria bacterium]
MMKIYLKIDRCCCFEDGTWSLSEYSACRFLAQILLRSAKRFNFQDFVDSWSKLTPAGMTAKLEHLKVVRYSCRSVLNRREFGTFLQRPSAVNLHFL